jgi:hypothetical protein
MMLIAQQQPDVRVPTMLVAKRQPWVPGPMMLVANPQLRVDLG